MSAYERIRRQQVVREAEGYLELLSAFEDQWHAERLNRDRLAAYRPLDRLHQLVADLQPGALFAGRRAGWQAVAR